MAEVCISSERMKAFLAGDLAASDEQAVVGHLESCPLCERLASEMSDDREVRKLAAGHNVPVVAAPEPEIEDLRRRLHALGLLAMAVDAGKTDTETQNVSGDGSTHDAVVGNGSGTSDTRVRQNGDSADEHSAATEPTQLGHYDVLKTLGAGSFGIVYLAEDRRLHRRVDPGRLLGSEGLLFQHRKNTHDRTYEIGRPGRSGVLPRIGPCFRCERDKRREHNGDNTK